MCVHTYYTGFLLYLQYDTQRFIALKCNFSMNQRRLDDFFGVQRTLHQNTPLLTFLFCGVFHVIANNRTQR